MKKLSIIFGIILTMVMLSTMSIQAKNNPANNPACEELTGKAKGICTAAVAIGCDDFEIYSTTQCEILAKHYENETGEQPPWNPCPCFTMETLDVVECDATSCTDDFDPNANDYTSTEWQNEENCNINQAAVWTLGGGVFECFIHGGNVESVTEDEAMACSSIIKGSALWEACP